MEIERKWKIAGFPASLAPIRSAHMRQGYLSVAPVVRIRDEGGRYVLCFKGKADPQGLAREEIETDVAPELFDRLSRFIGKPLIRKEQRRYALDQGLTLEVNQVDAGQPGEFFYAEVEFPTEAAARSWAPPGAWAAYLSRETTGQPGESMAAYWARTRPQP